ncbi:hypothetical protein PIB30_115889, partial [Stylosanthes scabra]|nr:hypothetical protein [Stylosanthes scabra]
MVGLGKRSQNLVKLDDGRSRTHREHASEGINSFINMARGWGPRKRTEKDSEAAKRRIRSMKRKGIPQHGPRIHGECSCD